MRVLFVTCLNKSHLYLLTPLAWAMQTAGHQVRVAAQPDLVADIAGLGLVPVPVGGSMSTLNTRLNAAEPAKKGNLAPVGRSVQGEYAGRHAHGLLDMHTKDFFSVLSPDQMIDDLAGFARTWRPDLVVWNTIAFAGAVAARAAGAASARMPWSVDTFAQLRSGYLAGGVGEDPMREWLEPIVTRLGCEFDEPLVTGDWTIDQMPPWVWHQPGTHYVPVRQIPFNGPSPAGVPEWVDKQPSRPRVCITLGVSHRESRRDQLAIADLFDAVADLEVEVVATLDGSQLESSAGVPDNVRVTDFVPLNALLPTCSAVVHHGGIGTFGSALEAGVPQLIVPGTFWHLKWWGPVAQANGLEQRGAGVYIGDADELTAAGLRDQLVRVLAEPAFGENARRLATEAAGRPSPNEVVPLLEKLTAQYRR